MAQMRLTHTGKWDLWFRKLSPSHKTLFDFLYDHCGQGGMWDRDDEVARLYVNDSTLDLDEFLTRANEGKVRIQVLKDGRKWFIVDYVCVQAPKGLKRFTKTGEVNRVHAPIYAELEKYGIDPSFYEKSESRASAEPLERLQDIDTDKDKEKGIVKGGRFSPPSLDELKAAFSEKGFASSEADKFMAYFTSVGWVVGASRKPMKNWRGAVATWCGKLRDAGVRPVFPQKKEPKPEPEGPKVFLSEEDRKALIEQALPGFGRRKSCA